MREQFVTFAIAENTAREKYTDSRAKYTGKSGLLQIKEIPESEKKHCDFFTFDHSGRIVKFSASSGLIVEDDTLFATKTAHSIYTFSKDYDLTESEELSLLEEAHKEELGNA